jgi:hypothetical protein
LPVVSLDALIARDEFSRMMEKTEERRMMSFILQIGVEMPSKLSSTHRIGRRITEEKSLSYSRWRRDNHHQRDQGQLRNDLESSDRQLPNEKGYPIGSAVVEMNLKALPHSTMD